jgi:hypothetical protein
MQSTQIGAAGTTAVDAAISPVASSTPATAGGAESFGEAWQQQMNGCAANGGGWNRAATEATQDEVPRDSGDETAQARKATPAGGDSVSTRTQAAARSGRIEQKAFATKEAGWSETTSSSKTKRASSTAAAADGTEGAKNESCGVDGLSGSQQAALAGFNPEWAQATIPTQGSVPVPGSPPSNLARPIDPAATSQASMGIFRNSLAQKARAGSKNESEATRDSAIGTAASGSVANHGNHAAAQGRSPMAASGHANFEATTSATDGLVAAPAARVNVATQTVGVSHRTRAETAAGTPATVPQVVASSPAKLDVGVFDGTHGWLRIRAEVGTGGAVNASLTASASAHESLRSSLPEMTRYLNSEAVSVNKLAVHRAPATPSSMAAAGDQQNGEPQGQRQAHGRNTANQTKKSMQPGESHINETAFTSPQPAVRASLTAVGVQQGGLSFALPSYGLGIEFAGSGAWLNVCA